MKIVLLISLILNLLNSSSYANKVKKFSFADLNTIVGIEQNGNIITFNTLSGTKTFDIENEQWSYNPISKSNIKNNTSTSYNFYSLPRKKINLPTWYQGTTYNKVVYTDSETDYSFILTAHAGEGATYFKQNLIEIDNKKVYEFPFEEMTNFLVMDNYIWIGSRFGIVKINRKTNERTDYVTLPAFLTITNYYDSTYNIFFTDKHYGLFSYSKSDHTVASLENINILCRDNNIKLLDLLAVANNLYIIGCKMDKVGRYLDKKQKTLLFIYNINNKTVKEINTGVSYANYLKDTGESIIGYGTYVEGYEGGESAAFGGAFIFNKKTKSANIISNFPIIDINTNSNSFTAKSMIFDDFTAKIRELVCSPDDNEFTVNQEIFIVNRYISREIKTGKVVEIGGLNYLKDDDEWHRQYDIYKKLYNKKRNMNFQNIFEGLKVQYNTIMINSDKIKYNEY